MNYYYLLNLFQAWRLKRCKHSYVIELPETLKTKSLPIPDEYDFSSMTIRRGSGHYIFNEIEVKCLACKKMFVFNAPFGK